MWCNTSNPVDRGIWVILNRENYSLGVPQSVRLFLKFESECVHVPCAECSDPPIGSYIFRSTVAPVCKSEYVLLPRTKVSRCFIVVKVSTESLCAAHWLSDKVIPFCQEESGVDPLDPCEPLWVCAYWRHSSFQKYHTELVTVRISFPWI